MKYVKMFALPVLKIRAFKTLMTIWHTWNAMFINAQIPFSLKAASGLFVKLHSISTAPGRKIKKYPFKVKQQSNKYQRKIINNILNNLKFRLPLSGTLNSTDRNNPYSVLRCVKFTQTKLLSQFIIFFFGYWYRCLPVYCQFNQMLHLARTEWSYRLYLPTPDMSIYREYYSNIIYNVPLKYFFF